MEKCYLLYQLNKYIYLRDVIVAPLYLLLIYIISIRIKLKLPKEGNIIKTYFSKALFAKIFGGILSAIIYQYFYGGGDSTNYFASATNIYSSFFRDPVDGFRLLYYDNPLETHPYLQYIPECFMFIRDTKTWTLIRIAAVLNIIAFDSYITTSILFSLISFFASWRFFKFISTIYPDMIKEFFYAIFMIPSVLFWGSGLFKDTIILSALFLITVHFYYLFIFRKGQPLQHIFWLFICFYISSKIRMFFVAALCPCLLVLLLMNRAERIRNQLIKSILLPVFLTIALLGVLLVFSKSADSESSELNSETAQNQAENMQSWHTQIGGATYSLGVIDFTPKGLLRVFPSAVNVALFRPYMWEVHSFFQAIVAFQSLFFLFFTIYVFFKVGVRSFLSILLKETIAFYFFIFSMLFAFITGFTSYNFGALDRYKIPCLSFYLISFIIIQKKYLAKKTIKKM